VPSENAEPLFDSCQECDDAPAITTRPFNGHGRYALCAGCAAFWDEHDLTTEVTPDAE